MDQHSNKKKFSLNPILHYIPHFLASLLASLFVAGIATKVLSHPLFGFSDNQMSLLGGITQSCAAIISICLLAHQLRKGDKLNEQQRDIDEAQFILQYNRAFIENKDMLYVERRLELFASGKQPKFQTLITDKNRQYFINYLVYFEGLALSILRNEIRLDRIDDLMGYRFFLIMNNPEVQKSEIQSFPDYYKGCINLYQRWKAYRESRHKQIPQKEHSLDITWPGYFHYIDHVYKVKP